MHVSVVGQRGQKHLQQPLFCLGDANMSAQISPAQEGVAAPGVPDSCEGKYLTFAIGEEEFGLEILKVREIIGYISVTPVPRTPLYVKGVINLRGQVIPVMDLRLKFNLDEKEITDQTCIIIIETYGRNGSRLTGLIVDRVSEVLDIQAGQIEPPPSMGASMDTSFILGMGKVGERVKILLHIDRVVEDQISELSMDTTQI
jgi:purine-binding chemotaxis protein CheW